MFLILIFFNFDRKISGVDNENLANFHLLLLHITCWGDSREVKVVVEIFSNFLWLFTAMQYFEKWNKKDRSPCPRRSYDPLNFPHNRSQYSLPKMNLFDQLLPCLVVTEVTLIKYNSLGKTLCVECLKQNPQLKVNLLEGKWNMKQYRPKMFLVCKFSVSISYAQAVAGQAHILNIKRIIAKLK